MAAVSGHVALDADAVPSPGQYATPRRLTGFCAVYFQSDLPVSGSTAKTLRPPVRYMTPPATMGMVWSGPASVSNDQAVSSVATLAGVICLSGE